MGSFTNIDGTMHLNREICYIHSIGYERMLKYLSVFKVSGEIHQVERCEDDVSLELINPHHSSQEKKNKRGMKRC